MQLFKALLEQRIGLTEEVTLASMPIFLEKFSQAIPFENLRIINQQASPLTKTDLHKKILLRNEGGVCYELNSLLYYYLLEEGWSVTMLTACIYNQQENVWSATGNTHVIILLEHYGKKYIVDAGFGANIPLAPVPLDGQTVSTPNGQFRIKQKDMFSILELKLSNRDYEWRTGYRFLEANKITDLKQLNHIQKIIETDAASPFNKSPLLTKRTTAGSSTLTPNSFSEWNNGAAVKQTINEETYYMLLNAKFNM
ncbi:N-hydroxyarylamine O-acetyltransferase [Terribacillus aidingensis]|uniref:N-hydroxyarylamine O-acetyltransferase n=1 Tax=Terribacillus aidingensis TaxID=586416 RepID=A0A285NX57_9BACI|nr:arylamine N-acetyltransferase [Terribacillus aidingensis]SNZ14064.1 N-hydroxyarylamine O-acetyltransferase [Terribacillus aidingensis]